MVNVQTGGWRSVIVPPPDVRAAIGAALRHAFPVEPAGGASPSRRAAERDRRDEEIHT